MTARVRLPRCSLPVQAFAYFVSFRIASGQLRLILPLNNPRFVTIQQDECRRKRVSVPVKASGRRRIARRSKSMSKLRSETSCMQNKPLNTSEPGAIATAHNQRIHCLQFKSGNFKLFLRSWTRNRRMGISKSKIQLSAIQSAVAASPAGALQKARSRTITSTPDLQIWRIFSTKDSANVE